MKVAFLIHSTGVNSCRYRVLQYLPQLQKEGVDASIHFYQRKWRDKLNFYGTVGRYQILYIHRKLFSPIEFWLIRKKARAVIYDFDDSLMYRSSGSKDPHSHARRMKFAYMVRRVDHVVAGNEFLRSEALRYNPSVSVIPTSIDLGQYMLKDHSAGSAVTVGWLGSSSTLKYLVSLLPVFGNIHDQYPDTQFKVVCDKFPDSAPVPILRKKWSLEDEASDLKSFDIGVMPLTDDLWSRGKCGLKILQYFGAGIPVVCTPVGVNRDIVRDGVNGYWAESAAQWEDRIVTLIRDGNLRKEMGLEGRKVVEQGYSLNVNGLRLLRVLREVSKDGNS